MKHILLTPPGEDPGDVDVLGILQVGCIPPWFVDIYWAMTDEGWIVQAADAIVDRREDDPHRVRGQRYFDDFMAAHRALDPRRVNN